jgi:hypothetical protein
MEPQNRDRSSSFNGPIRFQSLSRNADYTYGRDLRLGLKQLPFVCRYLILSEDLGNADKVILDGEESIA